MSKPWIEKCWMWQESDTPLTREEFVKKFFPQSLKEARIPYGGIVTNKHGRPVNWGSASSKKGRLTRFKNRIDAAYAEYRAIHPNKS